MATGVLTNAKVWYDGAEFSPFMFATENEYGVEAIDDTTMGTAGTRSFAAGLKFHRFSDAGYFEAGGTPDIDSTAFTALGAGNTVRTYSRDGGAQGEFAYLTRALVSRYSPFDNGVVGEMHKFTFQGANQGDPLFRGPIIHNAAVTATGSGSEVSHVAVASGETLAGTLHVVSVTGSGTIDVVVESDTTGFASPTTQLTFSQLAAEGGGYQTSTTATTDTFWRTTHTISGFTSVTYVVAIGIL